MKDYTLLNLLLIQNTFGAGSGKAYKVYEKISSFGMLKDEMCRILSEISFPDNVRLKLEYCSYGKAESIIKLCEEHNVNILTICDNGYPKRLKTIDTPPVVLYYKGKLPDFDTLPSITIVGPRKPSDYGKKAAFSLGFRLSRAGMIVVSGGAVGCDTAVHKGVLSADGVTVMVLGCGIDANYLAENGDVRKNTLKNGCIISEYPPLTNASKFSFPIRNRILAALTLGTVVVEAGDKSGALITAKCAAEQGRDVFVIPGNPSLEEYKGSNNLLREGAKPLIDTSDIFNEYLPDFAPYLDINKAFKKTESDKKADNLKKSQKILKETLSNEAKIVYNHLDRQIFSIDDLSALDLSADLILSALTELELEDLIKPMPGGKYSVK